MRRFFTISLAAVILFTAFLTKAGVAPASAATISPGCAYVNANGATKVVDGLPITLSEVRYPLFYVGETISVSMFPYPGEIAIFTGYSPNFQLLAGGGGNYNSLAAYWRVPTTGLYPTLVISANSPFNIEEVTVRCSPALGSLVWKVVDGRVNGDASQAGQTFAAYCNSDFSITVLAIDPSTGNGFFAFTATPADIAKVPSKPTVNTAIKSGQGATLYRLTGGNFQVNRAEANTGKTYSFAFSCGL